MISIEDELAKFEAELEGLGGGTEEEEQHQQLTEGNTNTETRTTDAQTVHSSPETKSDGDATASPAVSSAVTTAPAVSSSPHAEASSVFTNKRKADDSAVDTRRLTKKRYVISAKAAVDIEDTTTTQALTQSQTQAQSSPNQANSHSLNSSSSTSKSPSPPPSHSSSLSSHHADSSASSSTDKAKLPKKVLRAAAGETWVDSTLADWPDDDFRIFVGDLGIEVTDAILGKTFSHYTHFARARVIRDKKTQLSKGYGFVSFTDGEEGMRALKEMSGRYCGNRPMRLKKSQWEKRALTSNTSKRYKQK